jgi:Protein of unknown function (DUF2384)
VRRALNTSRATRTIEIPHKELHDPESGRIDAREVANYLDVPLSKLAGALGVNYPALHKTPSALGPQEKLRPIKQSIDLVSRITLSKSDARAWLNIPHPDLGGSTPIETIHGGQADAVVTLLDNALSGIPSLASCCRTRISLRFFRPCRERPYRGRGTRLWPLITSKDLRPVRLQELRSNRCGLEVVTRRVRASHPNRPRLQRSMGCIWGRMR